MEMTAIRITAL